MLWPQVLLHALFQLQEEPSGTQSPIALLAFGLNARMSVKGRPLQTRPSAEKDDAVI